MSAGRTKIALAKLLNAKLAPWGRSVTPEMLEVNRSRPNCGDGACSWSVDARGPGIYGFDTMRACLRLGITVLHLSDGSLNVFSGPPSPPTIASCFCEACVESRKPST